MKLPISIVIPSYNGKALLRPLLGSIEKYASTAEIIVVDDGSTDGTPTWLQTHYPSVHCVSLTKNRGFANAVNVGFSVATREYVLLLNNDTELVDKKSLETLKAFLELHPDVFAVGASERLPNGTRRGRAQGHLDKGILVHGPADSGVSGPTLWVFGASGLFRRQVFLELGGMSLAFEPAYFEDIELSFRAWKAGYRCWYHSEATILHHESATMNAHLSRKQFIALKNQLLCSLTSLTDWQSRLQIWLFLPYHLIVSTMRTKGLWPLAFFAALCQLVKVTHPTRICLTDKEVFEKVANEAV